MHHVGPAGYPKGHRSVREAMRRLKDLGLDAMELQFVRQARMGDARAREVREAAEEYGIGLSAHAPYYINFDSKEPATVVKSGEWVMRTARIAHAVGARVVVVHAAVYGRRPEETTSRVIDGLTECRRRMEEEGIGEVLLGVETMGRLSQWGTLEEVLEVTGGVPGTVPVPDLAHIHSRGMGALRTEEDLRRTVRRWEEGSEGAMHCHFSCVEWGQRGERRHLPLSAKEPDVELFARALAPVRREVTVITETPLREGDAARAKEALDAARRRTLAYH